MWLDQAPKIVKGMLVALALDAALSDAPDAGETLLTIGGAIAALLAAELYGSAIALELKERRRIGLRDLAALSRDVSFLALGAVPSLVLFTLAWLGALGAETAADVALWSGVALLGGLGLVADRRGRGRGVVHAFELAALGLVILLVKGFA